MEAEWDNIGRNYYQIPFSSATDMVVIAAKKKTTLSFSSVERVM